MAKNFAIVIKTAKETTYADIAMAFPLSASLNSMVQFTPMQKSNGTVDSPTTSAQYWIQRTKRVKAKVVANPNTGNTSDALAILDGFSRIDWETVTVATVPKRAIGIKISVNDKFDIDNTGEGHAKQWAEQYKVESIERKERLLNEMYTNATDGGTFNAPTADKPTPIFDKITALANQIELFADDFKYMTSPSNIIIVLHPTLVNQVYKEIGTVFNNEAPIYKTGLKSRFSIAGYPVLVDPTLNVFSTGTGDDAVRLGALVMDIEAVAFKTDNQKVYIDQAIADTRYVGLTYYGIEKLVDTKRAFKIGFKPDSSIAVTPKVSD